MDYINVKLYRILRNDSGNKIIWKVADFVEKYFKEKFTESLTAAKLIIEL